MTPEDEEFMEADSVLQQAPIPRIPYDGSLESIRNLVVADNSCVFYHGELLSIIELIKIPLTPITLFIQSYGNAFDMGSGRGVWDGSIIFGSWLCAKFNNGCIPHISSERRLKVLELGAGCSGVPGLCISHVYQNSLVVLSDAQSTLIGGLEQNIRLNDLRSASDDSDCVSAQILNWNDHEQADFGVKWNVSNSRNESELGKADVIIGAELLWAGCDPVPLLMTISKCLDSHHGIAYILMPKGGRGVEVSFLDTSTKLGFKVETVELGPMDSWLNGPPEPRILPTCALSQLDMNKIADSTVDYFQVHILTFVESPTKSLASVFLSPNMVEN